MVVLEHAADGGGGAQEVLEVTRERYMPQLSIRRAHPPAAPELLKTSVLNCGVDRKQQRRSDATIKTRQLSNREIPAPHSAREPPPS